MLCQLLIVADETLSIEAQGQFSSDAFPRYQTPIFQIMKRLRRWVFWKLPKTKPKKKKKVSATTFPSCMPVSSTNLPKAGSGGEPFLNHICLPSSSPEIHKGRVQVNI